MPEGKRCASAWMKPRLSREPCQQSSILTYWYPASRMPLATMASAVSRMSASLTLHWNLFQLFHPIGGVFASCVNFCALALPAQQTSAMMTDNLRIDERSVEVAVKKWRGAASGDH